MGIDTRTDRRTDAQAGRTERKAPVVTTAVTAAEPMDTTTAKPTDAFGGAGQHPTLAQPALPVAAVKAPTHYEAAPSLDQVAAGVQTLELGHKGPAVAMMQQALNKLGATPPLAVDGFMGPKTLAALQDFQKKTGVSPGESGAVGQATLSAVGERLPADEIDRMRDRAIAMWAISQGNVASVGRKKTSEQSDADIDQALKETQWTPEQQANVGNFKVMSQSDYGQQLGSGKWTIRQAGCMMSAYAMASTGLTGRDTNPAAANDAIKRAGGFSGSGLIGPTAARALGMREVQRTGTHSTSTQNMKNTIDAALAKGQAVVLGVDYKAGSNGTSNGTGVDHWLTVVGKDPQGNYLVLDPAGGKQITMHADANGMLTGRGWAAGSTYKGKEAVILDKA